jgi:regulator of protease activity HflC (stomatin/prohibitin superfamily)
MIPTTLLALSLAAGCNNAMDEQNKVAASQAEANDKIAAANKEADQKRQSAQGEADKTLAAATASFMKMREDYRHQTTNNLVELDHKVDVLEATSKVPATNKPDLQANLQQIHARRGAFATDYAALESASATTWDDAKARLDKEWTELKVLVDKA